MKTKILLLLSLLMVGCAGFRLNQKNFDYHPAEQMRSIPASISAKETESLPLKTSPPIKIVDDALMVKTKKVKLRPDIVVDKANREAKQTPQSDDYFNSIVRYDYAEGIIYQVYNSPKHITDIRLEDGEKINGSPCAGDTSSWSIVHTVSGSGKTIKEHIIVKPFKPGLETNLIITTNKRTYYLEIKSFKETYMAGVTWNYPANNMVEINNRAISKAGENISLNDLNFDYKISGNALFRPVTVFDDSNKTYIQFSSSIAQGELPPLFVLTKEDQAQLVNYRYSMENHCYIVDGIFEAAVLKMGTKRQRVVNIYNLSLKKNRAWYNFNKIIKR
jgi:type IV secretion system protein TrbG